MSIKTIGKSIAGQVDVNKLILGGGALLLTYSVVKKLLGSREQDRADQAVEDAVNNSADDGSTVSNISETEASSIATTQYDAMQGFGTEEERLFSSLEGLNGKALQLVYQKFGTRPGLMGGYWPVYAGGVLMDLFSWYRMELTDQEIDRMQTIWAKSGIQLKRENNNLL